jgi:hypothetical protein
MDARPTLVMEFATLDEAESALDWIGVDFSDAADGFEGTLAPDDLELLDAALEDHETPGPVRELAAALRGVLAAAADGTAPWRVAFDAG